MTEISARYPEDYKVGDVFDLGQIVVSREEIIEFSKKWDPQPFHIDDQMPAILHMVGSSRAVGM